MFSGGKLREAREEMREEGRKVSQQRFAELIEVSHQTPGRWERGEVEPQGRNLVRIAAITSKPLEFFFTGAPFPGSEA